MTAEALPTPRHVDVLLAHYAACHRNPTNEAIHFVCIPAIVFSLVGLLYALHPWAAIAFLGASLVYYARLSAVFFAAMTIASAMVFVALRALGSLVLPVSIAIFVIAWIGQFVGHRIEGRKPSFFEDVQYLWIGPLFCLSRLFAKLGIGW